MENGLIKFDENIKYSRLLVFELKVKSTLLKIVFPNAFENYLEFSILNS